MLTHQSCLEYRFQRSVCLTASSLSMPPETGLSGMFPQPVFSSIALRRSRSVRQLLGRTERPVTLATFTHMAISSVDLCMRSQ